MQQLIGLDLVFKIFSIKKGRVPLNTGLSVYQFLFLVFSNEKHIAHTT